MENHKYAKRLIGIVVAVIATMMGSFFIGRGARRRTDPRRLISSGKVIRRGGLNRAHPGFFVSGTNRLALTVERTTASASQARPYKDEKGSRLMLVCFALVIAASGLEQDLGASVLVWPQATFQNVVVWSPATKKYKVVPHRSDSFGVASRAGQLLPRGAIEDELRATRCPDTGASLLLASDLVLRYSEVPGYKCLVMVREREICLLTKAGEAHWVMSKTASRLPTEFMPHRKISNSRLHFSSERNRWIFRWNDQYSLWFGPDAQTFGFSENQLIGWHAGHALLLDDLLETALAELADSVSLNLLCHWGDQLFIERHREIYQLDLSREGPKLQLITRLDPDGWGDLSERYSVLAQLPEEYKSIPWISSKESDSRNPGGVE